MVTREEKKEGRCGGGERWTRFSTTSLRTKSADVVVPYGVRVCVRRFIRVTNSGGTGHLALYGTLLVDGRQRMPGRTVDYPRRRLLKEAD